MEKSSTGLINSVERLVKYLCVGCGPDVVRAWPMCDVFFFWGGSDKAVAGCDIMALVWGGMGRREVWVEYVYLIAMEHINNNHAELAWILLNSDEICCDVLTM